MSSPPTTESDSYAEWPALLLSASKDESVRLWNVYTSCCVAIFAGDQGHRDQVLSADVNLRGDALVSASMDNCIKVWALDSPAVQSAVAESFAPPPETAVVPFKTRFAHFPARKHQST